VLSGAIGAALGLKPPFGRSQDKNEYQAQSYNFPINNAHIAAPPPAAPFLVHEFHHH